VHDVIGEVVKNINDNCDFLHNVDRQIVVNVAFNMLLAAVTCLKHEGFHEERNGGLYIHFKNKWCE